MIRRDATALLRNNNKETAEDRNVAKLYTLKLVLENIRESDNSMQSSSFYIQP